MIRLADIITQHEDEFLECYGKILLPSHRKALAAIKTCRNAFSKKMLWECETQQCVHREILPHSCGHRHCPYCQNYETDKWLQNQLQKQVPGVYFLAGFTLPFEFRKMVWKNQRLVYSLMFKNVWATLKTFCINDKTLGGVPGCVLVLHTHSRELNFHPHIHVIIPAASIDKNKRLWNQKNGKYLFNGKALAKVFRAKMLESLKESGLRLPQSYPPKWNVQCKRVGNGQKALKYLARYLYRGVISEKNILSFKDGKVTFRYENNKTKKRCIKTVAAVDFIWLIIQHVLPKGFRRARNYGFLHPNSKSLIKIIQLKFGINIAVDNIKLKPRKPVICPCCGAKMRIIMTQLPAGFSLFSIIKESP
jgi:hypothetical protein